MLLAGREYARFAPRQNAHVFRVFYVEALKSVALRGTRDTCLRAVACCARAARVALIRHCRGRGWGAGRGGYSEFCWA